MSELPRGRLRLRKPKPITFSDVQSKSRHRLRDLIDFCLHPIIRPLPPEAANAVRKVCRIVDELRVGIHATNHTQEPLT